MGCLLNYIFSFTIINTILLCFTYQLMFWRELIDKLECSWCFYVLTYDFNIIMWNYLRGFNPHIMINLLYRLLYWDLWNGDSNCEYAINWACDEWWNTCVLRCVYWVVSYELCNYTIVRPFKGNEYYDGIHRGNPSS